MTTDRLLPGYLAIIVSLFPGAFDNSFFIAHAVHANFLVIAQGGRYPAKLAMVYIFSFALYFCYGSFGEIGLHFFIQFHDQVQFFIFQWRAGIAFLAAAAFAFHQVAYKTGF